MLVMQFSLSLSPVLIEMIMMMMSTYDNDDANVHARPWPRRARLVHRIVISGS